MRKLLWFAVGAALAAVIGTYGLQGEWYLLAAGVGAALLGFFLLLMQRFQKLRIITVLLLGLVIAFLWNAAVDHFYLSVPRAADEKRLILTLTATDYSRETEYGSAVEGIGVLNHKIYKLNVYLPKDTKIQLGDRITGRFLLHSTLPGGTAESRHSCSNGIFLSAQINWIPLLEPAEKLPWYGYPKLICNQIKKTISSVFQADTAGFAAALLLGDTDGLAYETDVALKTSGIRHIVAVSGLHVTILFAFVQLLLGKNRWLSAAIGLPILFLFAAVVGFSPSIIRACLMHSLVIVASLAEKEYDPLTALGFAVLVMLTGNFWTITSVSFQLSVCCMLGILLLSESIYKWILERKAFAALKGKRKRAVAGIAASVGVSVGSAVFVTPLCASYFGMVSLIGVLTNLLTLWVISFVFYGIVLACIAGAIWLPLGSGAAWLVSWPIRYILKTADYLSKPPFAAVYTNSIYIVFWLIFVYVLLSVCLLTKRKRPITAVCCGIIGLCIVLLLSWTEPARDECRVTVLDVGQGQCVLLQSQGQTFLVDCGGDVDTTAADMAVNELKSQGIHRLDGLILTHYDRDHAGGAAYLLQRLPADVLVLPDAPDPDGVIASLEAIHDGPQVAVCDLVRMELGKASITLIPSKSGSSDNEAGLCVLFQTENCDILITGDRSTAGERELMRQISLPQLEVLIVGHHGSANSTGSSLLEQTMPEIAIISVGADNPYGHPAEETILRLQEAGCEIYRTDRHGTVIYRG